ncbi:N-acetylmuramoyl-L-alanine amidase [Lederbergia galactosidilytica]|uniref:N-acetylmuramoyl-L-alanine amidase n=1 Tax=Lederbergia galactosidilytica TaxID=217031 RepID=UPI0007DB0849|nr:N-acetylmuramoyl-L-alanine amidase [Lederbergia galactosidilytica]
MAGLLNIPKLVDFRNKVKRHPSLEFPVLSLKGKTTIAVHHSLTKQGLAGSNAEGYARYHVDTLGWPSIGYSYVIEPDGTIKFCNDIELRTYHVGDHNNYAVGICLTGDFRTEKPTKAQEESLRNLVFGLQKAYPHLKFVKGHNEFSGYEWKACPCFDYKAILANKTISKPIENKVSGVSTSKPSKPKSKSIDQLADEVIKGLHGSGAQRKNSLGSQYDAVQKRVNEKLLGSQPKPKPATKSIDQLVKETLAGKHGNGEARKKSLGKNYKAVQDIINGKSSAPKKTDSKPKTLKVGQKVKIKSSAKKYATGQTIPSQYKNKTYTIQQVKSDRVLIKELYSWVKKSDVQ